VFQDDRTLKRFLLICERLIHKWQQNYYLTDWRSDKRALDEPSGDKKDSKKSEGNPTPRVAPLRATVGITAMVAARATTNETTAPRGKTRSTPTSTKKGSGLAVRPSRLSRHGWSRTTAVTNTQPYDSISVPMEISCPSSQRGGRIEHPTEAGRVRTTPPRAEVDRITDLRKVSTKDAETRARPH
jgi:hypothetical protein